MPLSEYRIEDLAHHSGSSVRTIRAYQDRGLLPKPERRGRSNVYDDSHLARLRQIADLLDRGYTLVSIKELLQAWDEGRGLGGVLGLVAEVDGPWTDEEPGRITSEELAVLFSGGDGAEGSEDRADLDAAGGPVAAGGPDAASSSAEAVAEAVALEVLVPLPGREGEFLVPSPQELQVAAELHRAGVPLLAVTGHLRELRGQVEHIAARFLEFTNEHVFVRYLGQRPSDADAGEAADLVRRLRPLAQQTVDAELARAMRRLAARNLRDHLRLHGSAATHTAGSRADAPGGALTGAPAGTPVRLPSGTLDAVRGLVGEERAAEFIAAAAEREVRARTMDRLAREAGDDGTGTN